MTNPRTEIDEHLRVIANLTPLIPNIEQLAEQMRDALRRGGKVVWMGNGGSAADSQHLASELVGRFQLQRKGLASIALTTDSSILTSLGNDFGFEQIFARQVEALCQPVDVVMGLSTSGNSRNVLAAIREARAMGAYTACLLGGNGGLLASECDLALVVPSDDTPRIQEAHILIGHILCGLVETGLSGAGSGNAGAAA
jgi:D-sedoheptulose 7-phosphate isomerase